MTIKNAEAIDKLFKEYSELEELYVNDFGVFFTYKKGCEKITRKNYELRITNYDFYDLDKKNIGRGRAKRSRN